MSNLYFEIRLADQYAALKRRLAQEYNHDRERYTQAKTEFINHVLCE
nr:GrpB family protein [Rossellomorea marisflavi]